MAASADFLTALLEERDLSREQSRDLMNRVMDGEVPPAQLAGILVALRCKGETVDEITGLAEAMREHAVTVSPQRQDLVDTCGTGGDGSGTFNISTATALVAAGMGCGVAKHGNRAVSSRCGSADVLEALGVNLDVAPDEAARLIDTVGLGFLFAPGLHPAMKHAMPARRELGVRTVFNVLGPLTNPAGARRQLLGVFASDLVEPLAHVLGELGSERAFVVHGQGGLDEVSLYGSTVIAALENGHVRRFAFHPDEAGLPTCKPEDLKGGSVQENAAIIRGILEGRDGPAADVVALNAAFVAVLADKAEDVKDGVRLARQSLQDGSSLAVLEGLVQHNDGGTA